MINSSLRHSLCFALCSMVFACGPRGSASDPLPLAPKSGVGFNYPTVTPETKEPALPPVTDEASTPTTDLTTTTSPTSDSADPNIPRISAAAGGDFLAQINELKPIGTADSIEIGAWNIENYPKTAQSKTMVSKVLNKLDVDIMGVEEIGNTLVFNELLKEMPSFAGVIAGASGGQNSQNVGVIYRTSEFKMVSAVDLFRGQNDAFPRPPLAVRLDPIKEGRSDIMVIVVHLKAFGDEDSAQRRGLANIALEKHSADLLAKEPNLQIVLLGDFNQPLINPQEREVFRPWFDQPQTYSVRTDSNVKKKDYSFFGKAFFSFIDHIIVSKNFVMEEPIVPKLQTTISDFELHASDHLPVIGIIR
ncbi:MAG: endonuclease/exonuclease/phosphatase family protein [Bdellovibrionota bacterium]